MYTKIRVKKLENGYQSLYLDTIYLGKRSYHFLKLQVKAKPSTEEEKTHRKNCFEIARQIAAKRDLELTKGNLDGLEKYNLSQDFIAYCNAYMTADKEFADIRVFQAVLAKLKIFTKSEEIPCYEITPVFVERFWKYLQSVLNGTTPEGYMKKLRRMIRAAKKERLFKEDPTEDLKFSKGKYIDKDVLTGAEIALLAKSSCPNIYVKMAALFSCHTGLRYCDIIRLKWSNIKGDTLDILQKKTKNRLIIKLNRDAIFFLRKRKGDDDLVFPLPSHTAVLKNLRIWVKNAEIPKKITYHCFRHTFGTNLIHAGVDVLTASKLLGHSDLKETMRYVRISEALKRDATQKLPSIFSKKNKKDNDPNNQ